MRPALFLPIVLAVALLPSGGAQGDEDDGCSHTSPCILALDVNQHGFYYHTPEPQYDSVYQTEFTAGDWYKLSVSSEDENDTHTVTLAGHDVSLQVEPLGLEDSEPFQFKLGTHKLSDSPSGDERQLTVIAGDAVEDDDASSSGAKDGPALPFIVLAAALVALAVLRRRD